ncbi:MAG: polysaccharide deacetylase family protein [Peptoniphilus sp.]|nr:polysaccharide deacetylase family protein [Peptoniphilus sp.]MDD7362841.1 polysaccharide deacetylase family protein [Bacillota bacterium]MDY6043967.1 polysaccharide deacetylase family protein [Peptoniphilus sp.]
MESKKFNKLFMTIVTIIAVCIMAFNIATDSFNVFGDRLFKWYAYDFTQNPRTAKITYLKGKPYKDFIIGASGASSIPLDKLKEYTGRDYYNVFYYGADLYDTVKTVEYLVDHYEVRSFIMPLAIPSASKYHENRRDLNYLLHPDVSGENKISFYAKYLFATPRYGIDKIRSYSENSYVQQNFDVFHENGSYDKTTRDSEFIGSVDEYKKNAGFDIPGEKIPLNHIDDAIASVKKIKAICDENNIEITFLLTPMYEEQNARYDKKEVREYYKKLSEVTDFWDFTGTHFEHDPRFFYDPSHFRNALGDLMLDKIFANKGDYGRYVDKVSEPVEGEKKLYDKRFYIFTFHHLGDRADGEYVVTPERFEKFLQYLEREHIQTVHFKDLINYVDGKGELPEKIALITFDDGYRSNLNLAYPLLKKYNQVATIFPIGRLVGLDKYPVNGEAIYAHFNGEEAKKAGDVFEYGSHTYFMHQSFELPGVSFRPSAKKLKNEDEADYIQAFRKDAQKERDAFKQLADYAPYVFAYPDGEHDDLTEVLLAEEGFKATVTSEEGINTITKNLPESLKRLRRINITEDRDLDAFRD